MPQATMRAAPSGAPVMTQTYDSDSLTIADGTTDFDVKANNNNLFSDVRMAHRTAVISDGVVTIKFNGTGEDEITITPDRRFNEDALLVQNVFISNSSGNPANVEIYIRGRKQPPNA